MYSIFVCLYVYFYVYAFMYIIYNIIVYIYTHISCDTINDWFYGWIECSPPDIQWRKKGRGFFGRGWRPGPFVHLFLLGLRLSRTYRSKGGQRHPGWMSFRSPKWLVSGCQYLGEGGIMSHIHIIFYVINVCQRISTYFSYRITCRHTDAFWLSVCHIESTDVYKTLQNSINCATLPCIEPCKRSN